VLRIDAAWVDAWIAEMKQSERLAPATIRAKIGATARACDWAIQLPAEAIMKITGHKTHKMVMRYLRLRGSSLAAHLW